MSILKLYRHLSKQSSEEGLDSPIRFPYFYDRMLLANSEKKVWLSIVVTYHKVYVYYMATRVAHRAFPLQKNGILTGEKQLDGRLLIGLEVAKLPPF